MNRMQRDVAIFNAGIDTPRGDTPEIRAGELRARMILEEAFETAIAMVGFPTAVHLIAEAGNKISDIPLAEKLEKWKPDLVEAIDGLTDLAYVTFGAFDAFGVDADPVFDIVHAANMTKVGAPKDANGKTMKPPGFVPPQERIRELLTKMGSKL